MRAGIVFNPISGRGRAAGMAADVATALAARRIEPLLLPTERPGDGRRQALAAVESCDAVIACGGDGTVSEVANALASRDDRGVGVPMAIAPAGRCNDFARAFPLTADASRCWHEATAIDVARAVSGAMNGGPSSRVPLMRAERLSPDGERTLIRYVTSVATLGFDARVSSAVDRPWLKRLGLRGRLAYFMAAMATLLRYRPMDVTLELAFSRRPLRWRGRVFMVSVANSPFYGGGIRVCPHARPLAEPTRARLAINRITPVPAFHVVRFWRRLTRGTHGSLAAVRWHRARSITIKTIEPAMLWADGEPLGETPITLSVEPNALRLIR